MKKLSFILLFLVTISFCEEWHLFNEDDGLLSDDFHCLEIDKKTNTVWASATHFPGVIGYGVNKYQNGSWSSYTRYDHFLFGHLIWDIAIDSVDGVWFSSHSPGDIYRGGALHLTNQNDWELIDTSYGLELATVYQISITQKNELFIFMGSGYEDYIYNQEHASLKNDTLGLFSLSLLGGTDNPMVVPLDSLTSVVAKEIPLVLLTDTNWTFVEPPTSYTGYEGAWDIAVDHEKNLWVIFSTGATSIYKYSDSTWTEYTDPSWVFLNDVEIDNDNNLWFTFSDRIAKLDIETEEITTFDEGPYEICTIENLRIDTLGNKWMIGEGGLLVFNEDEIVWGIDEPVKPAKKDLSFQAYPNPFNSSCQINSNSSGDIEIYNTKGKLIHKERNTKDFIWKPNEKISSGIYLLYFAQAGKTELKKITYMK